MMGRARRVGRTRRGSQLVGHGLIRRAVGRDHPVFQPDVQARERAPVDRVLPSRGGHHHSFDHHGALIDQAPHSPIAGALGYPLLVADLFDSLPPHNRRTEYGSGHLVGDRLGHHLCESRAEKGAFDPLRPGEDAGWGSGREESLALHRASSYVGRNLNEMYRDDVGSNAGSDIQRGHRYSRLGTSRLRSQTARPLPSWARAETGRLPRPALSGPPRPAPPPCPPRA